MRLFFELTSTQVELIARARRVPLEDSIRQMYGLLLPFQ